MGVHEREPRPLTVKELIAELAKYPASAIVLWDFEDSGDKYTHAITQARNIRTVKKHNVHSYTMYLIDGGEMEAVLIK